jgi:nitroreductase
MDTFTAIERRHSYRGLFTGRRVERNDLKKIVQAGIQAPSGCNAQTTSFVIVDEPATILHIGDIVDKPTVRDAKAVIVCIVDRRDVYQCMSFYAEDCAAAVENMLLAITALGYATVWLDGALRSEGRAQKLAELLGVPKDREVRVILPIGEPREECAPREKKPFAERAWFNRYGKDS